jgi:hypothetical protein
MPAASPACSEQDEEVWTWAAGPGHHAGSAGHRHQRSAAVLRAQHGPGVRVFGSPGRRQQRLPDAHRCPAAQRPQRRLHGAACCRPAQQPVGRLHAGGRGRGSRGWQELPRDRPDQQDVKHDRQEVGARSRWTDVGAVCSAAAAPSWGGASGEVQQARRDALRSLPLRRCGVWPAWAGTWQQAASPATCLPILCPAGSQPVAVRSRQRPPAARPPARPPACCCSRSISARQLLTASSASARRQHSSPFPRHRRQSQTAQQAGLLGQPSADRDTLQLQADRQAAAPAQRDPAGSCGCTTSMAACNSHTCRIVPPLAPLLSVDG